LRSLRVKTGDKVRIMRGAHKGKEGTVEEINMKTRKVFISKIDLAKKDGAKVRVPVDHSNIQLVEFNSDDKKRMKKKSKTAVKEDKNG
jgi:large subunit ribosomal protein L24